MKLSVLKVFSLGGLALIPGIFSLSAAPSDSVLARYHFSGTGVLESDANFDRQKKMWSLPESAEFKALILQRVAKEAAAALSPKGSQAIANSAVLLRPLMDDLVEAESTAVLIGPANAQSFALAIKLDKSRMKVWEDHATGLLAGWNFGQPKKMDREKFSGLVWKKDKGQTVQLFRAGEWLVIGSGEGSAAFQDNFLQGVRKNGRPVALLQTNFLEALIDWPNLKNWWPMNSLPLKPARTQLELSCKAGRIRTAIRATYPEPIRWKSQPWQIPTNTIRDPLSGFSAAQDLSPFVQMPAELTALPVNPLTNQFFTWAQADLPFQTFSVTPVKNAGPMLMNLAAVLPKQFNAKLKQNKQGELRWVPERNELVWQGLNLIVPALSAIKENAGEYLLAGAFQLVNRKERMPDELLQQLRGRTNLVFYGWEYTGRRLDQWRILCELLPILPTAPIITNDLAVIGSVQKETKPLHRPFVAKEKWLSTIAQHLENTATEITMTGPNDVTVVRRSDFGLTALEIVALARQIGGSPDTALVSAKPSQPANPNKPSPVKPGGKKP